jgi:hypothetical protein
VNTEITPETEKLMAQFIEFTELGHVYKDESGKILPSVTQILESAGLIGYEGVPRDVLKAKADLGTRVHKAAHYFDTPNEHDGKSDLDWNSVTPIDLPYVTAWARFREESGFEPEEMEVRMIGELSGVRYGMTVDRTGTLNRHKVLIEIKCCANVELSWGPQLAGYELGLRRRDAGLVRQRFAVQLCPDGRYKLHEYSSPDDYQAFTWALQLHSYKVKYGR